MYQLSSEQKARYKRNIILPGVGEEGQLKLLKAKVLLVGAGGLGSPAAYYLAAAGVGTIGLVDADTVDISNLQRQILHRTADIGRPKVLSAREKLKDLNPELNIEALPARFSEDIAGDLVDRYDIVIDCTDNFDTRYIINETCLSHNKPFVYGGVLSFAGQVMTILPGRGPCFRCLYREAPKANVPGCAELGILGAVPGIIGTLQATEAVKYIVGLGDLLVGRLMTYDALSATFFEVPLGADTDCPSCGHR